MSSENSRKSEKSFRSSAVAAGDVEEQLLALAEYRMPFAKILKSGEKRGR